MSPLDPDTWRAESAAHWDDAAAGWGRSADAVAAWTAGLAATMVDALALHPGERVLELAAGPGDTGFMAAELVLPGGTLISSDGSEAMVEVARARAAAQGTANVEFRTLDLEWIDLPTAGVDAVLCRWGLMLVADPAAAAREIRRVLRPGGRAVVAVWDAPERNPWTTIPRSVLRELGHMAPADPDEPGQFALSAPGALVELLGDAGLVDVAETAVVMERRYPDRDAYLAAACELSAAVATAFAGLDDAARAEVDAALADALAPFTEADGSLVLPGSSLVARASA